MDSTEPSSLRAGLIGQVIVVDLKSNDVCLGTLIGCVRDFPEIINAELLDFRDSTATREASVPDSARLGIRRNRARILPHRDGIVAVTRFDDISET
jgi:hypothetical protein